jgi:hypothetical protein
LLKKNNTLKYHRDFAEKQGIDLPPLAMRSSYAPGLKRKESSHRMDRISQVSFDKEELDQFDKNGGSFGVAGLSFAK